MSLRFMCRPPFAHRCGGGLVAVVGLALLGLAVMAFWLARSGAPAAAARATQRVPVRRGDLVAHLHETGVLQPTDGTLIEARVAGTLEWIVEDGGWVEEGERLYVLNGDQALEAIGEKRATLLTLQQELDLARLRREHAGDIEQQQVAAAEREAELAALRFRILDATPQGGMRLVELHEQLAPMEAATAQLRARYEQTQAAFTDARDTYLAALDAWQACMDAIAQVQARTEAARLRLRSAEGEDEPLPPSQQRALAEAREQVATGAQRLEELRAQQEPLRAQRDAAAAVRDAAAQPRDAALAVLRERETAQRELQVAIEIEKRGLEQARLELDVATAEAELAEARRRHEEGEAAAAVGSLSADQLATLAADVAAAEAELDILRARLAIARRPTPAEELTEARLAMERSRAAAARAREQRDRALAERDAEIAVLAARIAREQYEIDRRGTTFPEVIEQNIAFLREERAVLEAGQDRRRAAIDAEIAELEQKLAAARADPPHIGVSPVAGMVELARRRWGNHFHVGDDVGEEDVLMEVFPTTRMEVRFALNETRVDRVAAGMPVRLAVPALGREDLRGRIDRISGIGEDTGEADHRDATGVRAFEGRVELAQTLPGFRPGMSVVLSVETDRREAVLWLPRSALRDLRREPDAQRWTATVLCPGPDGPRPVRVRGELFDATRFIVTDGLEAGDTVLLAERAAA